MVSGLSQSKKRPYFQRCFRCFITVTKTVIREWAFSYNPPFGGQKLAISVIHQSHGIKHVLPTLSWQQLPGNEKQGFSAGATASVLGIQNWVSSIPLLWPHSTRGRSPSSQDEGTRPSVLKSQSSSSKGLLWHGTKPSALSPGLGSLSQELWGRCRCFSANNWKLCRPWAGHFRILLWIGYIRVIPMACMRTSSL